MIQGLKKSKVGDYTTIMSCHFERLNVFVARSRLTAPKKQITRLDSVTAAFTSMGLVDFL